MIWIVLCVNAALISSGSEVRPP